MGDLGIEMGFEGGNVGIWGKEMGDVGGEKEGGFWNRNAILA